MRFGRKDPVTPRVPRTLTRNTKSLYADDSDGLDRDPDHATEIIDPRIRVQAPIPTEYELGGRDDDTRRTTREVIKHASS